LVGQLAAREVLALARLDDIDGALTLLDDDVRFPDSWQAPQLALLRARLACGAGRLEEAAAAADTAAALLAELGDSTFEPDLRRFTALIAVLRGDMSRVRTQLAAGRQAGDELPLVQALLADAEGDPRAAAEVVALADAGLAGLAWPEELMLVAAACSARQHGDAGTVRAAAALLGERAKRNPDVASVTGAWLLAEALTMNDYAAAVDRLRQSPCALPGLGPLGRRRDRHVAARDDRVDRDAVRHADRDWLAERAGLDGPLGGGGHGDFRWGAVRGEQGAEASRLDVGVGAAAGEVDGVGGVRAEQVGQRPEHQATVEPGLPDHPEVAEPLPAHQQHRGAHAPLAVAPAGAGFPVHRRVVGGR
jgi:hypothetical protein